MSKLKAPTLPLYAFLFADAAFVVAAWWIGSRSPLPLDLGHAFAIFLCLAGGAVCGILPFLRQYQAELELNEADKLADTVVQIRELAKIGRVVREAADQWHVAQEASAETVKAAKGVFDKMAEETKSFHEFLENAHKTEINNLRLQVEKLRKTDQEWMQILVHILDHIFAIYDAARNSEHQGVARQLAQFRAACYDIVRRTGLIPFEAENGEPFDPRKFQLKDPDAKPESDAVVAATLATGYTFQGQLLRKALVKVVESPSREETPSDVASEKETNLMETEAKSESTAELPDNAEIDEEDDEGQEEWTDQAEEPEPSGEKWESEDDHDSSIEEAIEVFEEFESARDQESEVEEKEVQQDTPNRPKRPEKPSGSGEQELF